MAKKRSAAQKRATKKMLRAAKKARRAGKRAKVKSPRKRSRVSKRRPIIGCKPVRSRGKRRGAKRRKGRVVGKRKSAKRVAAGKKAARTRRRHKVVDHMASGRRKGRKSGKRKSAKRVAAGKKAARTRKRHAKKDHQAKSGRKRSKGKRKVPYCKPRKKHRKSRKHVLAGRKAAATRAAKRRGVEITPESHQLPAYVAERARRRRRKGRRKNPIALANPIRRRRIRRHRNPFFSNPLQGPGELLAGLFGVGAGYAFADFADRLLATHPLDGPPGAFTDTPGAGEVYDSEAPLLPLWSSPMRLAAAAGIVFVPGILSSFIASPNAKAFFQLAAYGAGAKVAGKFISDVIATYGNGSSLVLQAYAPEVAAQNRLASVVAAPLPGQAAGLFGIPKRLLQGLGQAKVAAPVNQIGLGGCGSCGSPTGSCGCSQPVGTDPVADAQSAQSAGQPNLVPTSLDSVNVPWYMNDQSGGPDSSGYASDTLDCPPLPMTQSYTGPVPTLPVPTPVTNPIQNPVSSPYSGGVSAEGGGTPIVTPVATPVVVTPKKASPTTTYYNPTTKSWQVNPVVTPTITAVSTPTTVYSNTGSSIPR